MGRKLVHAVAARFPHDHSHVVAFNSRPTPFSPRLATSSTAVSTIRFVATMQHAKPPTPDRRAVQKRADPLLEHLNRASRAAHLNRNRTSQVRSRARAKPATTEPCTVPKTDKCLRTVNASKLNNVSTAMWRTRKVRMLTRRNVLAVVPHSVYSTVSSSSRSWVSSASPVGVWSSPSLWPSSTGSCSRTLLLILSRFTSALLRYRKGSRRRWQRDRRCCQEVLPPTQAWRACSATQVVHCWKSHFAASQQDLALHLPSVGGQYYKYTVGGVNILFVNTLPLVFFTIFDFFVIERYVEHHHIKHGFLALISGQGVIFMLALGSVIPLSYFIGMAVASISAQSSIGMGAVINATFGSIIEIILYAIALTQEKARLVEGSLIGSILAGVLLMPGLSMCSGATRRKEQRFNARSAGVTSTMLIMAIIGILTPTLFYQIYGTFQLTCEGCPTGNTPGDTWSCRRCFYEHVPPATDPFFQQNVRGLMYTCTVILVLSYGVGLWFSLRTHASQIWQNPQPVQQGQNMAVNQATLAHLPSAQRASMYKRLVPAAVMQQLLPTTNPNDRAQGQSSAVSGSGSAPGTVKGPSSGHARQGTDATQEGAGPRPLHLPEHFSQEDYDRAVALTASAFHNVLQQQHQQDQNNAAGGERGHLRHSLSTTNQHAKHVSMHEEVAAGEEEGGHGGHDAPSGHAGLRLPCCSPALCFTPSLPRFSSMSSTLFWTVLELTKSSWVLPSSLWSLTRPSS